VRNVTAVLLGTLYVLLSAPALAQDTAAETRIERPSKKADGFEHPSVRLGDLKVAFRDITPSMNLVLSSSRASEWL